MFAYVLQSCTARGRAGGSEESSHNRSLLRARTGRDLNHQIARANRLYTPVTSAYSPRADLRALLAPELSAPVEGGSPRSVNGLAAVSNKGVTIVQDFTSIRCNCPRFARYLGHKNRLEDVIGWTPSMLPRGIWRICSTPTTIGSHRTLSLRLRGVKLLGSCHNHC